MGIDKGPAATQDVVCVQAGWYFDNGWQDGGFVGHAGEWRGRGAVAFLAGQARDQTIGASKVAHDLGGFASGQGGR